MTDRPIRRALLSVSDKTGLVDFARALSDRGVEILSTGGSAAALRQADIPVTEVADHTGFPEIMDGRVKTLHPTIHGGLLALRDDPDHAAALRTHGIGPIDLVAVTLYPFEATVAGGADPATIIENIDIGGPSMIRSAAKNHLYVTVLTDPADYARVLDSLERNAGATDLALRRSLASKAYARTAAYDGAIAAWFSQTEPATEGDEGAESGRGGHLPAVMVLTGTAQERLRYGENPHQKATLYRNGDPRPGVTNARQLQGKPLSYNNIADTDAAYEAVAAFEPPAVVIVKHANPCGVAVGRSPVEAYYKALASDPVSAFGGIVALNRPLDAATAAALKEIFLEVVIAPGIEDEAASILSGKKALRLLDAKAVPNPSQGPLTVKGVAGGLLVQSADTGQFDPATAKVVTKRTPSEAEMDDLRFAWTVVKYAKSNAIVYAKGGATVGIGAGMTSRVDAARHAAAKAAAFAEQEGEAMPRTAGAVVASDAFFPFADGLQAAIDAGVTAAIQPGGSVRDAEVIKAADDAGITMIFTGMRHFRH